MGKFNLAELMSGPEADPLAPRPRTIDAITGEILDCKVRGGEAILRIGQCLTEAKELLPHGEWLPWLQERVEFTPRQAQRFMRIAREWSNATALSHLGATKALQLLSLPPEERESFAAAVHVVDGEAKEVAHMSSRELEQAIRERDEARARTDALTAQLAREAEARQEAADRLTETERQLTEARQAEAQVARLTRELEELRAAPVEVAVMEADQQAIDRARAEAVAEAEDKLKRAREAKCKAEERQAAAEEALAAANARVEALERAEKRAALSDDRELAAFEVLFEQGKELASQMRSRLLKARARPDGSAAAGMEKALLALAEAIRRCAE